MSDYRLYYSPGACSLAPHIALEELGIAYEAMPVPVAQGANQKPDYLAINPRGRVPALVIRDVDGERVLTEVPALLVYLAGLKPEARLLPASGEPLARAVEWMSWLTSSVHAHAFAQVFRPARFVSDENLHAPLKARGLELLDLAYRDIEQRLQGRDWALGADYSLVDAYLLVFYRWGYRVGVDMRARYPGYTRLVEAVVARPAVRRALQQEQIVVWESSQ